MKKHISSGLCLHVISRGFLEGKWSAVRGSGLKDPNSTSSCVWTACQLVYGGSFQTMLITMYSRTHLLHLSSEQIVCRWVKTWKNVSQNYTYPYDGWCYSFFPFFVLFFVVLFCFSRSWARPIELILQYTNGSQSAILESTGLKKATPVFCFWLGSLSGSALRFLFQSPLKAFWPPLPDPGMRCISILATLFPGLSFWRAGLCWF